MTRQQEKDELLALLNSTTRLTFLTGAGVSTNSGIPDFQTIDQHWDFPVSRGEATSIGYFRRDPKNFWRAFRYLFDLKTDVAPNAFHHAVAGLEAKGKEVIVLTQNIDGLHTAAGSTQVGELHGNIQWAFCSRHSCPERVLMSAIADQAAPRCDRCRKYLRPDTVLFGEEPRGFGDAKQVVMEADVLLVAGTALEVGPVNDLPRIREWWFPERPSVWLNRKMSPYGYHFSHFLHADLNEVAEVLNAVSNGEPALPDLP